MAGGAGDDVFVIDDPDFLNSAVARDLIIGGAGNDTLVLRLDNPTRSVVEGFVAEDVGDIVRIDELGLTAIGIEEIIFADRSGSLVDLVDGDLATRVEEAELWGFL